MSTLAAIDLGPHLERLAELEAEAERREFFAEHPELAQTASVETLVTEVARSVGIDLERAGHLAELARWLAAELGDERARALAERSAANVQHFLGETARAQELYERALGRFEDLGQVREAAIVRSSALLNLAYLGDYERVRDWYRLARESFRELGDRLRLAILEHNYGNVLYRQDRWNQAYELYREAYHEFLELGRFHDAAICLRNLSVCHISLHRFEEALEAYETNRAYCVRHGLERIVHQIDYNIAYLYYLRGEYGRSLALFRDAREESEAEGDDYHRALCDLDMAEIYLELNLIEEAAELAQSAIDGFERLEVPYETAKALTWSALALSRRGQGEQALGRLARAREIFESEDNPLWSALVDFYRALVLRHERRSSEALEWVRAARRAFSDSDASPRAAMCDLLHAELLLDLGEPVRARETCREVLAGLEGLELPALEQQAHLMLGRSEEALGETARALEAYGRSRERLERLRSQLHGEDLKIAFLKDKQEVYESLFWLTLAEPPGTGRDAAAFDCIEQAKSRSLTDLLAFRANALAARDPRHDGPASRVRSLREELSWLYRQLDVRQMRGGGARSGDDRLRRQAREKEDELLRALRVLRASDPELGSLQASHTVDPTALARTLPRGAVLVEYYLARGTIFAAIVDPEARLEVRPVAAASKARESYRLLQLQLSKLARDTDPPPPLRSLYEEATRHHLGELYRALVAPLEDRLASEHLVVVPHGFLHYVPFHALWDGERHLIDRFALSYAPNAGVFQLCAAKRTTCEERSLVLGVADERAPEILAEAEAVASALPGSTLLLGDAASETALKELGPGCRYVHIATHGLFRRDNPMFSAIQLGETRLSLFDLYQLRLDAELAVLSGCGTGLNAVLGADELVGLTRGLLYAGAQSVLVTLWDVHDASTAHFMRRFYHHLAAGAGRARALQKAMWDLREERPHPYYWAPFVLVGKSDG